MVESQPCPRCKKVIAHYFQAYEEQQDNYIKNLNSFLELYAPYKSWSPKGRGNITFTKHAFECPVCEKRWVAIE